MKKTMHVMVRELRITLGRKSFMIVGFGIPLLLGIVAAVLILTNKDKPLVESSSAAFISTQSSEQTVEGFVDEGNLIQSIPDGIPTGWLTEFSSEALAQEAMDDGKIDGYYIVSPDYENSGDLIFVRPTFSIIGDRANTGTMEWILAANLLGDTDLATEVWQPVNTTVTSLADAGAETNEDSWIVELFPTIMTLIIQCFGRRCYR